jgi:hypothetical protein
VEGEAGDVTAVAAVVTVGSVDDVGVELDAIVAVFWTVAEHDVPISSVRPATT